MYVLANSNAFFLLCRWNDIGNIAHNKSSIVLELINKEENVLFHTVRKRSDQCHHESYLCKNKPLKFHFPKEAHLHNTTPPTVHVVLYAESEINFI